MQPSYYEIQEFWRGANREREFERQPHLVEVLSTYVMKNDTHT
jgi:hypothetical protein